MEIDNWFKEESKSAIENGSFKAFIPHHLEIDGREDLLVFPRNIMFSKYRTESDGSLTMGSTLYIPDLSTLVQGKEEWSMKYRNQYGGDSYVIITLTLAGLAYTGEKFVDGVLVYSAAGVIKDGPKGVEYGWDMFFIHLTMLGLKNGEQCKFEKVIPKEKPIQK